MSDINTRIKAKRDTTANWNHASGFIPLEGEIIVYIDYEVDSEGTKIPAFKVGDGRAYVQDLPFVSDDIRRDLINHINNRDTHVTLSEKEFWNNKVNIDDSVEQTTSEGYSLQDDTLIFNRN